jgi:DNA-directed RNA polymerase subunit alpha
MPENILDISKGKIPMVQITEPLVDLFADKLPSLGQLQTLSDNINSSEKNGMDFTELLESHKAHPSPRIYTALGIGLYILGRNAEAVEMLQKAKDCMEKYIYLAYALCRLKKYDQAIANLQKSLDYQADNVFVTLNKAAIYRQVGNFEASETQLKNCKKLENISPDYHYQLGRLYEVQGLYEQAANQYAKAIELSPSHQKALFHLAYRCDLSGDEEAAKEYYKAIASTSPAYVSAMLNLAVLYEDSEQYDKSYQCIELVLQAHPNHPRALLFKKDIESSKTMVYDEEKEKKKTFKNQILETPISDFELSVRSRNCLKKMNIQTIGDLLNISESELLSYKNFGETSLKEVKAILETKGLHLGMAMEEKQFISEENPSPAFKGDQEQGLLNKSIDDLQLSVRARKTVQKLNLRTIGELTIKTEAELLGCKNFGVTSLNEIKKTLADLGLSLRSLD